jgi:subtilase family serine protease
MAGQASQVAGGGSSSMGPAQPMSYHGGGGVGGGPIGYSPAQIRHAYGFDRLSATGAGATIAVVEAFNDPTIATDVAAFDSHFGLASINLTVENQNGGRSLPTLTNSGWQLETSLDVEWAHAIAPGAKILLIEANDNSFANLYTAIQTAGGRANVVSMSWGRSEFSGETGSSYDGIFASFAKVTFVASSGDSGTVSYPSTSHHVLSVGGTTLPLDSSGNLTGAETAWSSSGGGPSTVEAVPGYQKGFYAGPMRGTPDVSYDANPSTGYAVYVNRAWYPGQIGGASAGAPQWAGLVALADQFRLGAGKLALSSTSLTSRAEYTAAGSASYRANYRDITSGSNGSHSAGNGYDLVTGLGSPLANHLVPYLAALP